MKHYVLTRWNKMSPVIDVYNHPEVKDPESWNRDRMAKFEKYCLPGMMNQTNKDFTWLLSFSEKTPDSIWKKYADLPNVVITYQYPATYVRDRYGDGLYDGDWLCTSRLDNDDAVSDRYMERVKGAFRGMTEVIDFSGYQYDTRDGKWYHSSYSQPFSPFISFFEQVGHPIITTGGKVLTEPVKTAFRFQHSHMFLNFPSRFIDEKMYVQVIHGANLRCQIRGVGIRGKLDGQFWDR